MLSRPNAKSNNYRVTDFTVDSREFCNQIENFAKENGAIFNYNCAVKKLNIKNGKVIGVQFANGTSIPADLGKLKEIDNKELIQNKIFLVMICSAIWTANFAIKSNIHMLPLRGASMDLIGTNMSDENLVQVMLTNKVFVFRTVRSRPQRDVNVLTVLDFQMTCSRPETPGSRTTRTTTS